VTVPLTAAFIFVLLAIAALAIDVGIAYSARASVQHAADAAALAGAFTFVNVPNAVDPAQSARDDAAAIANSNYVLGQQIAKNRAPVNAATVVYPPCTSMADNTVCVDPFKRRVTVKIMVPLGTYFASIWPSFGLLDVRAVATAEAAPAAAGSHCVKPLFIPNTAMNAPSNDGDGGNEGNGGNGVNNACARKQTFFDPVTMQPTLWAQSKIGSSFVISPAGSNTGHEGEGHGNGIGPNQYMPLDYGNGTAGYSCGIKHCLNDPACSDAIDPTLFTNFVAGCTGTSSLKTLSGVAPSITQSAFQQLQGQPADRFLAVGEYGADASSASDTSNSVVTLPVWNNCDPNQPIATSSQQYAVIGMVQFFLDPPDSNGNITAHLVGFANCDANENGTGPGGIPVRLVNVTQ
jgi:hypothetical protein